MIRKGRVDQKIAIVTRAAQGIRLATAKLLAEEGAFVSIDESKFVTGAELLVDGGILAGSAAPPGALHRKENI